MNSMEQMPSYVKFMESTKRKLVNYETIFHMEGYSGIIVQKLSLKLKTLVHFTFHILLGNINF